jgi:hypothetical protein
MPTPGQTQAVPLRPVRRPDFSIRGIDASQTEAQLPEDVLDLWNEFARQSPERRQHFLAAGSMWQLALTLGHEYQTTRFAWMVAACEALKPRGPQSRNHNIYDVVEVLLGMPVANQLKQHWFRPQDVRNAHLHGGELRGSEFVELAMTSTFQDPTFRQAEGLLYQVTQEAMIEWLRRSGAFTMPRLERRRRWRRWIKDHFLSILLLLSGLALATGLVLGWLLNKWMYALA